MGCTYVNDWLYTFLYGTVKCTSKLNGFWKKKMVQRESKLHKFLPRHVLQTCDYDRSVSRERVRSVQSFIWRNIQIGPLFWNVFLGKYLKFNLHYTKIKTVYIMRRKQFYNVIIISWAHNRTLPLTCKYNCASKVWIGYKLRG